MEAKRRYVYDMHALETYAKMTGVTYKEIARELGVAAGTISRYATGDRLPDIGTLVRLCNTFRLSVGNFIYPEDAVPERPEVWMEEEWKSVSFRLNRPDVLRMEHNLTKRDFVSRVNEAEGTNVSLTTYNRISSGEFIGHEFVLGMMNTFGADPSYFFDDAQLAYMDSGAPDGDVCIPRKTLLKLKDTLRRQEDEIRLLRGDNNRLRRRERLRVYDKDDPRVKADKAIRSFLRHSRAMLDELEGLVPPDDEPSVDVIPGAVSSDGADDAEGNVDE